MNINPLNIALSLYEISGPLFISLKVVTNPISHKERSHPADRKKLLDGIAVIFKVIKKTKKDIL